MATGSFSTISIHRLVPVINGFVQDMPNVAGVESRTAIADALGTAGTQLIRLSGDSNGASAAGGKYGLQELIEMPGVAVG